jgi:hypothetical protein
VIGTALAIAHKNANNARAVAVTMTVFPDRIEYDRDTERYRLRHSSDSSSRFPEAETDLYIRRADLVQAFGRSAVYLR